MKATDSLFKWYNDLPPWARGVVVVGGIGIATYTTYSIVKSINNAKKQQAAQAEAVGFVNDLNTLNSNGIQESFQQSQYQTWADSIANSFSGCDSSTPIVDIWGNITYSDSGQVVANIISNFKNDADFLALQAAWAGTTGSRTISKHWWCGGDDTNVTLTAAITDQLSADEISFLNKTLAANGLSYTF